MSRFQRINENAGNPHRTSPIDKADVSRIARVVAYILTHYVDPAQWSAMIVRKGSVTLQHVRDPHRVIKVFVDENAGLWAKLGFSGAPPTACPVAIGIELTALDPFEREAVRDSIAQRFRLYADPRQAGFSKWWLQPVEDHRYDIVVLESGECEDVPWELAGDLERRILAELPEASE